jgi:predicted Fe-S protein YdhL (DUF1289 family)
MPTRSITFVPKPLDSPCIDVCQLDPITRVCIGCLRTIDEIARWSTYTTAERRRVLAELPARKAR